MTAVTVSEKKDNKSVALKKVLERQADTFTKLLPPNYDASRLITGAMIQIAKEPKLLECSHRSIALAMARVAQWGLDIGITAHLLPFKGECVPVVDYKGYIELMRPSGVRKLEAFVVRQGEVFEYQHGTEEYLRHQPNGDRTKPIIAAYAMATLKHGYRQFEVMLVDEIEEIRAKYSKQWRTGDLPEWYARKTVIRRIAKYLPKNPRLVAALASDGDQPAEGESEIPEGVAEALPEGMDPETGEVLEPTAIGAVAEEDDLPL